MNPYYLDFQKINKASKEKPYLKSKITITAANWELFRRNKEFYNRIVAWGRHLDQCVQENVATLSPEERSFYKEALKHESISHNTLAWWVHNRDWYVQKKINPNIGQFDDSRYYKWREIYKRINVFEEYYEKKKAVHGDNLAASIIIESIIEGFGEWFTAFPITEKLIGRLESSFSDLPEYCRDWLIDELSSGSSDEYIQEPDWDIKWQDYVKIKQGQVFGYPFPFAPYCAEQISFMVKEFADRIIRSCRKQDDLYLGLVDHTLPPEDLLIRSIHPEEFKNIKKTPTLLSLFEMRIPPVKPTKDFRTKMIDAISKHIKTDLFGKTSSHYLKSIIGSREAWEDFLAWESVANDPELKYDSEQHTNRSENSFYAIHAWTRARRNKRHLKSKQFKNKAQNACTRTEDRKNIILNEKMETGLVYDVFPEYKLLGGMHPMESALKGLIV